MAIAFIVTVVGAQTLVDSGGNATTGIQELSGWPIVFELPPGFRWGAGQVGSYAQGSGDRAVFKGLDSKGYPVYLKLQVQALPEVATLEDALDEMALRRSGWHNKMDIGEFDGVVRVFDEEGYLTEISAAGFDGEGLGIHIVFRSALTRSAAMQTFRSLCNSIEYR